MNKTCRGNRAMSTTAKRTQGASWLIERGEQIRVVTAYDLDAGQKKDYLARRGRGGEEGKEKKHQGNTQGSEKEGEGEGGGAAGGGGNLKRGNWGGPQKREG